MLISVKGKAMVWLAKLAIGRFGAAWHVAVNENLLTVSSTE
jgi:hypothetical protein